MSEDHLSGCDEVDLAGVATVGDEESSSSLDGWGNLGADRETEGSGERLEDPGGGVGGGAGLYIFGLAERMTSDSRISTWTSLIS